MNRANQLAITIFAAAGLLSGVAVADEPARTPDQVQPADDVHPQQVDQQPAVGQPVTAEQRVAISDMENLEKAVAVGAEEPTHRYGGTSVSFGGGAAYMLQGDARSYTDTGGSWDLRLAFGTRLPVALEMAYIGSVSDINTLGLEEDTLLVSNGGEVALRWNILPDTMIQPYLMGGIAWRHYELARQETNMSNVNESDNVFEVPLAAGAALRYRAAIIDLRVGYRHAFDSELIPESAESSNKLHMATADVKVGFEF